jgi:hypothetical protein
MHTNLNREWIRLRRAYGATGYELTRIKKGLKHAPSPEGSRINLAHATRMIRNYAGATKTLGSRGSRELLLAYPRLSPFLIRSLPRRRLGEGGSIRVLRFVCIRG